MAQKDPNLGKKVNGPFGFVWFDGRVETKEEGGGAMVGLNYGYS